MLDEDHEAQENEVTHRVSDGALCTGCGGHALSTYAMSSLRKSHRNSAILANLRCLGQRQTFGPMTSQCHLTEKRGKEGAWEAKW